MREKVLLLEERYILAASYDYFAAEILTILDSVTEPLSYQDVADRMMADTNDRKVGNVIRSFEEAGLVAKTRTKGGSFFQVNQRRLWEVMQQHGIEPSESHALTIDIPNLRELVNNPDHWAQGTGEVNISMGTRQTSKNGMFKNSEKSEHPKMVCSNLPKLSESLEVVEGQQVMTHPIHTNSGGYTPSEVVITKIISEFGAPRVLETYQNWMLPSEKGGLTDQENSHINTKYNTRISSTPYDTSGETDTGKIQYDTREDNVYINGGGLPTSYKVPPAKPSKKKSTKYYDWKHYDQFSSDQWSQAKKTGVFPDGESAPTMLIGAYLIAAKKKHGIEFGLVSGDFGKYLRLSKNLLEFMTQRASGDEQQGFRDALAWIHEFVACDETTFIGKSSWSIQLAFSRDMYRQIGTLVPTARKSNERVKVNAGALYTQEEYKARGRYGEGAYWALVFAEHPVYADTSMQRMWQEMYEESEEILRDQFDWTDDRLAADRDLRLKQAKAALSGESNALTKDPIAWLEYAANRFENELGNPWKRREEFLGGKQA